MRDPHDIITSQIPREELLGLLDTMAPGTAQRVTAELLVPVIDTDLEVTMVSPKPLALGSGELPLPPPASEPVLEEPQVVVRFASDRTSRSQPTLVLPPPSATVSTLAPDRGPLPRWVIVAVSFGITLVLSGLVVAVAA